MMAQFFEKLILVLFLIFPLVSVASIAPTPYSSYLISVEQKIAQAEKMVSENELPNSFARRLTSFDNINTQQEYLAFLSDGSSAEALTTFTAVTGHKKLSKTNYEQVLNRLLHSTTNTASEKKHNKKIKHLIKMFTVKINKNDKARETLGKELTVAIKLFNSGLNKLIFTNPHSLRQLLFSSADIGYIEGRGQVRNKWQRNTQLITSITHYLVLTGQITSAKTMAFGDDIQLAITLFEKNNSDLKHKYEILLTSSIASIDKELRMEQEQFSLVKGRKEAEAKLAKVEQERKEAEAKLQSKFEFIEVQIISCIEAYSSTKANNMLSQCYRYLGALYASKKIMNGAEIYTSTVDRVKPYINQLPKNNPYTNKDWY